MRGEHNNAGLCCLVNCGLTNSNACGLAKPAIYRMLQPHVSPQLACMEWNGKHRVDSQSNRRAIEYN